MSVDLAAASPAAPPVFDRWRLGRRERRNLTIGLLFVSPWLIGFFAFLAYPLFYTLRISLTEYSGFGEPTWIGLENYRRLFGDDLFWIALYNTLFYTALAVPLGACVAMGMAIAMNQGVREVVVYRTILFLPSVLPLFALSFIYLTLMHPTRGIFNQVLLFLGLPNVGWFTDPDMSKITLVILAQFGAGQVALIFLAGLKGIPVSLYEAAMLDGAGAWRRFRNITLPLMTPIILYDLILGVTLGFQVFTQIYILFDPPGGPANSTTSLVLYLYDNAFRYGEMGYASALAWVIFALTVVLALVIFRSANRWVHYDTV